MTRIALAQQHFPVGDVSGNVNRIIGLAIQARDELQADLIVFPELALIGYPPDDLLLRQGFVQQVDNEFARLVKAITGIAVVVGYPEYQGGVIYNAAAVISEASVVGRYRKMRLPNYGVFDEKRHFSPGSEACVFELNGCKFGITICEDLWGEVPAKLAAEAGADVLLNLNASPFEDGKLQARRHIVSERAAQTHLPIIYVNCVGGQDELVFDGSSGAYDATGEQVLGLASFDSALAFIDVDASSTLKAVSKTGTTENSRESLLYKALVTATRDYVEKNGFPGVVLGLSGGIDSALVCAIAVDALGADRVWAVSMPSCYTASMSVDDAREQAELAGARFDVLPIESPVNAYDQLLAPIFAGREIDLTEENLQARIRGNLLMALSNKFGHMLLATGNKSEMAVGYATLYGDMAGGFAPLKDLYKTDVFALAKWRNRNGVVIPERVIERPPTAELRPDQKDSDSLPPYERLDPIIRAYVEDQSSVEQIAADGQNIDEVTAVVHLIRRAEYKRQQAAPGPKLTARAFGRDRRMPISVTYGNC